MQAEDCLRRGAGILDQKLGPLGFRYELLRAMHASGGDFAEATLTSGDRSIRLWYRFQLGGVFYQRGDHEIAHADLMARLGKRDEALYPGFPGDDPMSAFPRLLHDFDYLDVFFQSDDAAFLAVMQVDV